MSSMRAFAVGLYLTSIIITLAVNDTRPHRIWPWLSGNCCGVAVMLLLVDSEVVRRERKNGGKR